MILILQITLAIILAPILLVVLAAIARPALKLSAYFILYLGIAFIVLFTSGAVLRYGRALFLKMNLTSGDFDIAFGFLVVSLGLGLFVEAAAGWRMTRFLWSKVNPRLGLRKKVPAKSAYEEWCQKVMR